LSASCIPSWFWGTMTRGSPVEKVSNADPLVPSGSQRAGTAGQRTVVAPVRHRFDAEIRTQRDRDIEKQW
jgi:hypothetical protein